MARGAIINGLPLRLMPAQPAHGPPRADERSSPGIDCLIGEKVRPARLDEKW